MSLRSHIRAARAYAAAYSAQAYNVRRQMTGRADEGVMLLMKQMEAHAAAHSRAAEIMEAEQAAEYGSQPFRLSSDIDRSQHHKLCSIQIGGACDYDCARDGVGEAR